MAESFHSQMAIKMDEEIKTAVKEIVNSKFQCINEFISKMDEKLDVKFTEMIEAIRLLSSGGARPSGSNERSPPPLAQVQQQPPGNLQSPFIITDDFIAIEVLQPPLHVHDLMIHEARMDDGVSDGVVAENGADCLNLISCESVGIEVSEFLSMAQVLSNDSQDIIYNMDDCVSENRADRSFVKKSEDAGEREVRLCTSLDLVEQQTDFPSSLLSCMEILAENEIKVSQSEVLNSSDGVCLQTVRRNAHETFNAFLPPAEPPDDFINSVQKIVYEMSKGSKYFEHEERKEALMKQRIENMRVMCSSLTPSDLFRFQRVAEEKIVMLEATCDLTRIWFHVDMDAFYATVETLSNLSLKGKLTAVGSLSMICTANYEAQKFGVCAAMPGFIARKLRSELILVPTNLKKYTHDSDLTRKVFQDYDPKFLAASLDKANLDITEPCMARSMSEAEIVDELRVRIYEETGLTCSAGVAPNRLLTKVCSDINKPNGQFILPNDRIGVMTFISSLPLRKVGGIGMVTENILKDVCRINTCEQLLQWVTKPPPRPPDFWFSQLVLKCYDDGGAASVFGPNLGHGIDSSYDARQFGGAFGGATGINFGGSHGFGNGVNQDFVGSYGTRNVVGPNMMVDPYSVNGGVIYTGNCDMVLGILCLATLGTILWNIEHLTMEFKVNQRKLISKLVTQNAHLAMICVTNIEATDELSFFEYPESQPPLPNDIEVVFMITVEDEEPMVDVSEGFANEDVLLVRNVQLAMLCMDGVAENEQCNIKPRFFEHTPITSDIDVVLTEFERVSTDPTMLQVVEQWPLTDMLKKGADKERNHRCIIILFFSLPRPPEVPTFEP